MKKLMMMVVIAAALLASAHTVKKAYFSGDEKAEVNSFGKPD